MRGFTNLNTKSFTGFSFNRIKKHPRGGTVYVLLVSIGILSILLIVLWLIILNFRTPESKYFTKLSAPTQTIWAMYDAALRRDIEKYLNTFMPELQTKIKDTIKSKGDARFRAYLQDVTSGIMGVSIATQEATSRISREEWTQADENTIIIPVEIVYNGLNKLQLFTLKRAGDGWKILKIAPPVLTPQPIPYGKDMNK